MINAGWSHEALLAMSVHEAAFWVGAQADYDKAVADAIAEAREE